MATTNILIRINSLRGLSRKAEPMTIGDGSTARFFCLRWLHMLVAAALLLAGVAPTLHAPAIASFDGSPIAAMSGAQGDCVLPCENGDEGRAADHQGCNAVDCTAPAILDTEPLSVSTFAAACDATTVVSLHSEQRALETPPPIL